MKNKAGLHLKSKKKCPTYGVHLKLLHKRKWSLFTPENQDSHFVSCDHPVVLSWRDQEMSGPIGFGLTNTEVTFPISKRYMLVGIFEDELDSFYEVPDTTVAFANSERCRNAQRHVYSSNDSYIFAQPKKLHK